jgi:hypothetical protein
MRPDLNGSTAITLLALGFAMSAVLNLYLLNERRRHRRFRVHPWNESQSPKQSRSKSPTKEKVKKERPPKTKKPTRAERKAAAAYRKQQLAEQAAAEKRAEEVKAKAARGAAWEGDHAGLSMMEQAAMFVSQGELEHTPVATLPKLVTPARPAPVVLPPVVATPFAGASLRTQAPAYEQFSKVFGKSRVGAKLTGQAYQVTTPASGPPAGINGLRTPQTKSSRLLAAARESTSGSVAPLPAPTTNRTALSGAAAMFAASQANGRGT